MKTGIFTIPAEAYHADPADVPSLSSSIATLLCNRSPRHAWTAHPKLNPDFERTEESKFDVGTACHALLLEDKPIEDVVTVVDAKDWRTKAAQEARDDARANHKIPLLADQLTDVVAMLAATAAQLEAVGANPPLFRDGMAEQTLIWEEDGVVCRALVDWLRDDYWAIDDFKTTSASADPDRWTRTLFTIGADVQTAFYLRGLHSVTDRGSGPSAELRSEMRYVVQETYPPYALSVIDLGPDVLAVGNAKVEYAIKKWRECLEADSWPGYPAQVCTAELPAYEETRWLEKMMREQVAA